MLRLTLLMSLIGKRIDDNIMTMGLISYPQYPCFILSIAVKRSIADKATSFAIFGFDLSEFLLAVRTAVFASMIVELSIIFDIGLVMYAWIIPSAFSAGPGDYLEPLAEGVVL